MNKNEHVVKSNPIWGSMTMEQLENPKTADYILPMPIELTELVTKARIDYITLSGKHEDEATANLLTTALEILSGLAMMGEEEVAEYKKRIEDEWNAAQEESDTPPPEIRTLSKDAAIEMMCGLFNAAVGLEEHDQNALLETGILLSQMYGAWEGACRPEAERTPWGHRVSH